MADNNNVFTAVDQVGYDYYGDGTDYSDCWTYPKEKIDELVGDSLTGIETAKEEAIAAVQEAGSDAVQEIEEKGEETLESIPDDYTQLSEDVSSLKADLTNKADIIVSSASGAIASFSDGADGMPMKSVVCEINPVQDLHGQEYPYPAGGGKNKCNAQNPIVLSGAGNIGNTPCVIPAGTYTYSANTSANVAFQLSAWTSGGTQIGSWSSPTSVSGRHSMTFTISEEAGYIRCYYNGATTISDIQVESGSTATSFAPYSNICPISGWDAVNVFVRGYNLFNKETITPNSILNGRGAVVTSSSLTYAVADYTAVVPNTTYYFKDVRNSRNGYAVMWYDANKAFISPSTIYAASGDNASAIATAPSNARYVRVCVPNAYLDVCSINYPSTDTFYHAYAGDSITVSWTSQGTVYGGTLTINDDLSAVLVGEWASVDLGNAEFSYNAGWSCWTRTAIEGSAIVANNNTVVSALCSIAKAVKASGYTSSHSAGTFAQNTSGSWFIDNGSSTELSGQLVYRLATPVTYNLTVDETIELLKGFNNVWHDANGNTEVQYRADTKKYIDNKFAELQTLIANS